MLGGKEEGEEEKNSSTVPCERTKYRTAELCLIASPVQGKNKLQGQKLEAWFISRKNIQSQNNTKFPSTCRELIQCHMVCV